MVQLTFNGTTTDTRARYLVVVEGSVTDINSSDERPIPGAEVDWLEDRFTILSGMILSGTDDYDVQGSVVHFFIEPGSYQIIYGGQDITGDTQQIVEPVSTVEPPDDGNGGTEEPPAEEDDGISTGVLVLAGIAAAELLG